MSVSKTKLLFWAKNKYNVCFSGKHGVGKTAQVKEIFNELYGELGEDWLYFSASSMDPWVDFVGVPKEKIAEDGVSYLSLVRPEVFARDQVKALFIDEFNRAPKKVRNSVMELLQFGSINGHKFNNLEVIWTAINPSDEEDTYDVEEIDPAQLDRFHVFVEIPYSVSKPYFVSKYGREIGSGAVEWWNALPESVKSAVSPRRLDYVLDCFVREGDIRDILPKQANAKQLLSQLANGSIKEILKKLHDANDSESVKQKFSDLNFLDIATDYILKNDTFIKYFIPFLPPEKFVVLLTKHNVTKIKNLLSVIGKNDAVHKTVQEILKANSVTGAKKSALKQWEVKNYPPIPVAVDSSKYWENTLSVAETENTPERRNNVYFSSINILKTKNLNKVEVTFFYTYLFTAYRRAQLNTCNVFNTSTVSKALLKCQKIYPLEDFVTSDITDFSLVQKVLDKMQKTNVISAGRVKNVLDSIDISNSAHAHPF